MTPEEARTLWVKALRSGEYKQTRGQLRQGDAYCCLGVACDLYGKHVLKEDAWKLYEADSCKHYKEGILSYTFLGQGGALPRQVVKWPGLDEKRGTYAELKKGLTLMQMNDDPEYKEGFNGIADVIEKGGLVLEEEEDND